MKTFFRVVKRVGMDIFRSGILKPIGIIVVVGFILSALIPVELYFMDNFYTRDDIPKISTLRNYKPHLEPGTPFSEYNLTDVLKEDEDFPILGYIILPLLGFFMLLLCLAPLLVIVGIGILAIFAIGILGVIGSVLFKDLPEYFREVWAEEKEEL